MSFTKKMVTTFLFSYQIKYKCFRLPPEIFHVMTLTISLTLFPTALLQAKWAPYCSLNQALKSSGLSMTPELPALKNLLPSSFCNATESSVAPGSLRTGAMCLFLAPHEISFLPHRF